MHDYRHPAAAPRAEAPLWRRLAPGLALGLVLAGGSAVSLTYLTARWQEQAPVREAARQLRARLEAEQRARDEAARTRPPEILSIPSSPPADGLYASDSRTYRAAAWFWEPTYTVEGDQLAAGFRNRRLEVEFRCMAGVDGRLRDCTAYERPAGSGLGRAVLPQLSEARLRPMQVGGEYQEIPVGFTLSFDFRPMPGTQTASLPAGIPPSAASSTPAELFTDPDPVEPAPVS